MQKYTSANTSINSKRVPALFKKIKWEVGIWNLDIGGGKYNTATEYLLSIGVCNYIYDPYNRTFGENQDTLDRFSWEKADTGTLSNVLCTIAEKDIRLALLKLAKRYVAGNIYISVYEGDGSGIGRETKKDCWQNNKKLGEYWDEIVEVFPHAKIIMKKGFITIIQEGEDDEKE